MPRSLLVQAPAKLNLALSVGAPDAGGMHPISSWMVTVDLFDDLHLEQLSEGSFSLFATVWHAEARSRSDIEWSISKDLVQRAHAAMEARLGRQLPIKARVEKRIPIGGGLGGGSSDAAAMLRGLNELFDLGLAAAELCEIAAPLGSDVPFLVEGGSALVSGTGDRIESLGAPPALHATLFMPGVVCPTGPVYQEFDRIATPQLRASLVRALAMRESLDPDAPFNDLAHSAQCVAPAIAEDMEEIASLVALPVHVCGSGSSLFSICSDPLHAAAVADLVTERLRIPAVAVATTVTPPTKPL
jgi:4-diphosphocytidyl-2-C-methyl-D-erythritol kinase